MRKIISVLLLICTLTLCFVSCSTSICETCDGSATISCRVCYGLGKEHCLSCRGGYNGHCPYPDCDFGIRTYYKDCPLCVYGCGACYGGTYYEKGPCTLCDGTDVCFDCDGTRLKEDAKTCDECKGTGKIDCPDCE